MGFMGAALSVLKGLGGAAKEGATSALKNPNTWMGKPAGSPQGGGPSDTGAQPMAPQSPLDLAQFAPKQHAQPLGLDPSMPYNMGGAPSASPMMPGAVPMVANAPLAPVTPAPVIPSVAAGGAKKRLGIMDGIQQ